MTTDQQFNPFAEFPAPSKLPVGEVSSPGLTEADVRRIVREELRDAFTGIAEWARTENQWEYDSLKVEALNQIGSMAVQAAKRLERRLAGDQS